jgi:hypothetical protein
LDITSIYFTLLYCTALASLVKLPKGILRPVPRPCGTRDLRALKELHKLKC